MLLSLIRRFGIRLSILSRNITNVQRQSGVCPLSPFPPPFARYGTYEMPIPVKSIPALVFDEMWHPFYVFQYFSIVVW